MEQFRKIGLWCWEYKERFVLTVMVLILGYRVYFLVYPDVDEYSGSRIQHPSSAPPNEMVLPPRIPEAKKPIPLSPLIRDPLFLYTRPGRRGDSSNASADPGQDKLRLVRIVSDGEGNYKAQIFTGASKKLFAEGASFESYTVLKIDADEECVEIYSENTNTPFELCIE